MPFSVSQPAVRWPASSAQATKQGMHGGQRQAAGGRRQAAEQGAAARGLCGRSPTILHSINSQSYIGLTSRRESRRPSPEQSGLAQVPPGCCAEHPQTSACLPRCWCGYKPRGPLRVPQLCRTPAPAPEQCCSRADRDCLHVGWTSDTRYSAEMADGCAPLLPWHAAWHTHKPRRHTHLPVLPRWLATLVTSYEDTL